MRIIGKILILLLVFCIGFVSAFGALFGAGYYAYKNLSLDKVGVNTESVFDREAAEVQLSALTIEGLVSEIQTLQGISDKLTLDMMILRYGLIIPENVDAAIPQTARTLPLAKLFSKEGIVAVLDDVYIGQLLQYEKGELIPGTDGEYYWYQAGTTNEVTGLYSVLVNYTIGDLIEQNFDVNKIMADLTIAKVLNLSADNYSEAYIEVNGELVPFEGLEEEISIWRNSDGAMVSPTIAALADISVSELSTSLDDIAVSSLLGFVEQSEEYYSYEIDNNGVGEIVVLTKQTGLTAELSDLTVADFSNGGLDDKINEMKIATVLGYTYNEEDGKYYDSDGEAATGVTAVIAGSAIGEVGSDINNVMIGEVCGFTKVEDADGNIIWYSTYSEEDPTLNVEAEGVMAAMADLTINDLGDNDKITDRINTITVADALGYKPDENGDGYVDKNGDPVTGAVGVIAGSMLSDIQATVDAAMIGELCGFTRIEDADGNVTWYSDYYGEDDERNVKASGVMAAIADSTIGNIDEDINDVLVGEVCGFTKVEDEDGNITWYDEYYGEGDERNIVAKGVMAAIAGSAIGSIDEDIDSVMVGEVCGFTKVEDEDGNIVAWYSEYYGEDDERNVPAKGVMASMADLTVGELGDDDAVTARVETITVADALGYELDEDGEGYVDKNGDPVTGVMGVLAGTQLVNIQSTVDDTMVGELCGFTRVHVSGEGEDAVYKWYSEYDEEHPENNVEATGVMAVMVDLKVSELKDDDKITAKIETITVADALGYKPDASGDGYVDKNGKSVTGVMGVLAGTKLNGIQGKIDDTMIGEVSGFTKIEDGEGNITWYSKYDKEHPENNVEAGGIMNAIADLKVSELKEDGKLTERIETLTVADALGYKPSGSGDGYVDKNNNPVTGVMGVIAGTKLNGIQAKIDGSKTGELMGLTYDEESGKWKDNGKDVHVLMNKIASTPFEDISGITSTLTVEDIIPADQRDHGFISLLDPNKKLDEIGPEVNRIFQEEPLKVFIKNEVIVVDDHLKPAFNDTDDPDELADMTLSKLFAYAAGAYMTQNGIPIIQEDNE